MEIKSESWKANRVSGILGLETRKRGVIRDGQHKEMLDERGETGWRRNSLEGDSIQETDIQ